MRQAAAEGVRVEELSAGRLVTIVPALTSIANDVHVAYLLPDEFQIRAPKHLRALLAACRQQGVEMHENCEVTELELRRDHVVGVKSAMGRFEAREFCLCGGSWTQRLLEPMGIQLPVEPWRGQLILWKTPAPLLSLVVNEGLRYLVPRLDGHLIAGATVEDVGFDCRTTEEAIQELREYSCQLIPALRNESVRQAWAGLRPKTPDGNPFLGRVPGCSNLSVASGHYRSGLHLSPATAVFMAQLLLEDRTEIDPTAFRIAR
jgi:glycine oxidase